MKRSELREHIFRMLFRAVFHEEEELNDQMEFYLQNVSEEEQKEEIDEKDRKYMLEKVQNIIERIPELDKTINDSSDRWKTNRMGRVDLTILRLAVYEIIFDEDIPQKVAINEAVELSKKYSGEEAFAFVNGVLAKVCRQKS